MVVKLYRFQVILVTSAHVSLVKVSHMAQLVLNVIWKILSGESRSSICEHPEATLPGRFAVKGEEKQGWTWRRLGSREVVF